jgi:hypothetical protein
MDRLDALTDLCEYLKNWFDDGCTVHVGKITIAEGTIQCSCDFSSYEVEIANGQYFRVAGSIYNDGIHQYPDQEMADETFEGSVTPLKIPPVVLSMLDEIIAWRGKYEALDSTAMSPYQSESFAGYSYSKAGAGGNSGDGASGWQAAFKNRLTHWRKI